MEHVWKIKHKFVAMSLAFLIMMTPIAFAVDSWNIWTVQRRAFDITNTSNWDTTQNATLTYDGDIDTYGVAIASNTSNLLANFSITNSMNLETNTTSHRGMVYIKAGGLEEWRNFPLPQACFFVGGDPDGDRESILQMRYRSNRDGQTGVSAQCWNYLTESFVGAQAALAAPQGAYVYEAGVNVTGDFRTTSDKIDGISGPMATFGVVGALIGCGLVGGAGLFLGAAGGPAAPITSGIGAKSGCEIGAFIGLALGASIGLFIYTDVLTNENN